MRTTTAQLTGASLDWAVGYARCLEATDGKPILASDLMSVAMKNGMASPSTNWAEGEPIIEREIVEIHKDENGWWVANESHAEVGPTLLVAAMRCYVASKLGNEIDVPQEAM